VGAQRKQGKFCGVKSVIVRERKSVALDDGRAQVTKERKQTGRRRNVSVKFRNKPNCRVAGARRTRGPSSGDRSQLLKRKTARTQSVMKVEPAERTQVRINRAQIGNSQRSPVHWRLRVGKMPKNNGPENMG